MNQHFNSCQLFVSVCRLHDTLPNQPNVIGHAACAWTLKIELVTPEDGRVASCRTRRVVVEGRTKGREDRLR